MATIIKTMPDVVNILSNLRFSKIPAKSEPIISKDAVTDKAQERILKAGPCFAISSNMPSNWPRNKNSTINVAAASRQAFFFDDQIISLMC